MRNVQYPARGDAREPERGSVRLRRQEETRSHGGYGKEFEHRLERLGSCSAVAVLSS